MEKKDIIIALIILVVAIVAGCLSAYQYIDGVKTGIRAKNLQEEVVATQKKLILAQEKADHKTTQMNLKLEEVNNKLQNKTEELLKAQEKIIGAQSETIKNIKGFGFAEVKVHANRDEFFIQSKSEYNMFEVSVEILDYDRLIKCDKRVINGKLHFSMSCLSQNVKNVTISSLQPKTVMDLAVLLDKSRDEAHYLIKIISNNVTTIQYSVFRLDETKTKFTHYYRIFELIGNERIYKLISESSVKLEDALWQRKFPYKEDFIVD